MLLANFARAAAATASGATSSCKISEKASLSGTCGLVAMTSAQHAEGRQFDPGQVYFSRSNRGGALARSLARSLHTVQTFSLAPQRANVVARTPRKRRPASHRASLVAKARSQASSGATSRKPYPRSPMYLRNHFAPHPKPRNEQTASTISFLIS